jgi:hypothetical protein
VNRQIIFVAIGAYTAQRNKVVVDKHLISITNNDYLNFQLPCHHSEAFLVMDKIIGDFTFYL